MRRGLSSNRIIGFSFLCFVFLSLTQCRIFPSVGSTRPVASFHFVRAQHSLHLIHTFTFVFLCFAHSRSCRCEEGDYDGDCDCGLDCDLDCDLDYDSLQSRTFVRRSKLPLPQAGLELGRLGLQRNLESSKSLPCFSFSLSTSDPFHSLQRTSTTLYQRIQPHVAAATITLSLNSVAGDCAF